MGKVYLARSPGGRAVALKVVRTELAENHGFRVRFAREVAAARGVSGVFTAAVVDADPDAETPWMATAYVDGPSLAAAVEEDGPLPPGAVLSLAAGLAEGLQAIHRAGLVHRDLKPSNVLLASDGPRVIDFGISWAGEGADRLTDAGTVVGSPGFVSPEQALGRQVGPASDVFSLGAVLVFAATGKGPFGDGATQSLMYRVVHEPPDLSGLPDSLRHLLEACLAKDPGLRPTVGQLLDRLQDAVPADPVTRVLGTRDRLAVDPHAALSEEPATRVEHPGPPAEMRRPATRRWWPLALAAAGVVVAAIVLVPLALSSSSSPQPAGPSAPTATPGVTRGARPAATASPTPGSKTPARPSPSATTPASARPAATVPVTTSPAASTSASQPAPPTTPAGSRAPSKAPTTPAPTTTSPSGICLLFC